MLLISNVRESANTFDDHKLGEGISESSDAKPRAAAICPQPYAQPRSKFQGMDAKRFSGCFWKSFEGHSIAGTDGPHPALERLRWGLAW